MLLVALTGGIGSGKSLAGQYFSDLGAIVVDSDQLARAVVERGTTGFDLVLARFGDQVLTNGDLDRKKLGEIVFSDPNARADLEAITHPLIRGGLQEIVAASPSDSVIINQIPLLVETSGKSRFDKVIVITTPIALRRERLRSRGMRDADIERRISAQASDEQRLALADYVLTNDGDADHLLRQVERLWEDALLPAAKVSE